MRILLSSLVAASLLAACGDNFASVQAADTIEAYEQFLADNPDTRFQLEANARLESLYLEKARKEKTLEAYDAYLERFPEGDLREKALGEREEFLYDWAKGENTLESWTAFLDEYPRAEKKRRAYAKRMLAVHEYQPHLTLSETKVEEVNLAEDPEGPKDGWGFEVMVTNDGQATVEALWLTIEYLDDAGKKLDGREWPVVAPEWPVPIEEEHTVPMKPGETRRWFWSAGGLPETWSKKVRVFPSRIQLKGGKVAGE